MSIRKKGPKPTEAINTKLAEFHIIGHHVKYSSYETIDLNTYTSWKVDEKWYWFIMAFKFVFT